MKAYQKWEDAYCGRTDTACPVSNGCHDCMTKRKEGWRAAMERVLSECTTDCDEWDRPTGYLLLDDDVIKTELEN